MEKDLLESIANSVAGIYACQMLLYQHLIEKGIIDKNEIANMLDSSIMTLEQQNPVNMEVILSIKQLREHLAGAITNFPPSDPSRKKVQVPAWLKIIQGGNRGT